MIFELKAVDLFHMLHKLDKSYNKIGYRGFSASYYNVGHLGFYF